MALANPLWGAPRIHGELLKLGLDVSQRTGGRLMPRRAKPPSQTWRTLPRKSRRRSCLGRLLRRAHGDVPRALRVRSPPPSPPPSRTFQRDRFPYRGLDGAAGCRGLPPRLGARFLIRDRDGIFGGPFRQRVKAIGLAEVLTTPHSPWQNPFAERVIGTVRRELLDLVIVLNER